MTLFQPLWPTRPGPEARQRGWDELQAAEKLAAPTDRERAVHRDRRGFLRRTCQ